jgi:hypothetical protein
VSENQSFDLNNISQLKDLEASYFIVSHMEMNGFVFCMLLQYRGQESQAIIFPSHPKWGLGSPPGLSKLQSLIAGAKTPHLEMFFITLERY